MPTALPGAPFAERAAAALRAAGAGLLDLVFPMACVGCGRAPEPGRNLCWECSRTIRFQSSEGFCPRCGREYPGMDGATLCGACTRHPPAYDLARSAAHFGGVVRELVHGLKYHAAEHLVPDMADLLEAAVARHYAGERIDFVCPVPLHGSRRRKRGFNQAALLADELARRLGVEAFPRALRRIRDTPTQTHLGADERRRNVRGAFEPNPLFEGWFAGRTALLVDDVMTTGATLSEAALALRRAGAARILALTVARD